MRFVGGLTLIDGGLRDVDVSVADGHLSITPIGRDIDLSGCLILPGIVDLHGDAFDRHIAARRGAVQDMSRGYWNLDAEFGASGISTAVLAQFYSWEGGMRSPAFARRMMAGLAAARRDLITDMRMQLRLEVSMVDDFDDAENMIAEFGIEYVVLNDHLPREKLRAGKTPPRLNGTALKSGRSPEKHLAYMHEMLSNEPREEEALKALSKTLVARGVRLGSHDDRDAETREIYRAFGASIAEFPETSEAAEAAKEAGDPVVIGAPNVVRGASHNGNASGRDLVVRGLVDALVSDYHYPSLIASVETLDREGLLPLEKGWDLISAGPAQILGLSDRGRIAEGLRADLTILDAESLRVVATLCEGRFSFLSGDLATRALL